MTNLTDLKEWQALTKQQKILAAQHMRDLYAQDAERFQHFSLSACGILLDYSRNLLTSQTLDMLCALAQATGLKEKIRAQFSGVPINTTENRPVLHTALRDPGKSAIHVNGNDVIIQIQQALTKMREFTRKVHAQKWKHIVNIGIGGSFTGPMMAVTALKEFAVSPLRFHFISSIDKTQLDEVFEQIEPEHTLFIISSKSFTTIETLTNAQTCMQRMREKLGDEVIKRQFVAVTAAAPRAEKWVFLPNIFFPCGNG